jgi:hypothetical protein
MADPRLGPKFEQIEPVFVTFKYDNSTITYSATATGGSAGYGLAVSLASNSTVQLISADELLLGKLHRVESDGTCLVQIGGVAIFAQGNAVTTTAGKRAAGALGAASAKGYIKNVADAATPTAAEVNNLAQKGRGIILDNSDTANVVVWLD